jgi:hypothetical protein
MRGLLRVIKAKDENEFLTVGKLVLNLNKSLAVAGPALAGTAALASVFIGSAVLGTALASVFIGSAVLGSAVLKQFSKMATPSVRDEDIKDFAGKLF